MQLGTTEIAQMTRMPQPTVWRLCYTLQQLGYLVQSPDNPDKLRIGMAVDLGSRRCPPFALFSIRNAS